METTRVSLGADSYDIMVGDACLIDLGQELRQRGLAADVLVFTSPRIGGLYYDRMARGLREAGFCRIGRHDIPDGEEHKNADEWLRALDALTEFFPPPSSRPLVLNLGGGVVGDLGGFAAHAYRRGVPYVQVPTSLLACVDGGIGGKLAFNRAGIKNLVGGFQQPKLVYADLSLLKTLDPREIRSGVAEVIKYGAVCDRDLFAFLEENVEGLVSLDMPVVRRVVRECYHIKAEVVGKDERDNLGIRIVLNFGHTVGHALEMAADYRMTHGEAISVGMVAATKIGISLGTCSEAYLERLEALIQRAGLPTSAGHIGPELDEIMDKMRHDKKFVNGVNRFVLPVDLGKWCERQAIEETLVRDVVQSCTAG